MVYDDVRKAADRLVGIVMAIAYPNDFTLPTIPECKQAIDAYDTALAAVAAHESRQKGMIESPQKHERHYCRECDHVEQPTFVTPGPSAHIGMFEHLQKRHPDVSHKLVCTRFCRERAQPEEINTGKKLYGPGSVSPVQPIMTLDQVLPNDEHM